MGKIGIGLNLEAVRTAHKSFEEELLLRLNLGMNTLSQWFIGEGNCLAKRDIFIAFRCSTILFASET